MNMSNPNESPCTPEQWEEEIRIGQEVDAWLEKYEERHELLEEERRANYIASREQELEYWQKLELQVFKSH